MAILILTNENKSYNLDKVPEEIDDLRYCVFDTTEPDFMDYFFMPLIFLESWYSPAAVLKIGEYCVQMPLDWSVIVCDEDYSSLEVIPITDLNECGFHTIIYNPMKHMVPLPLEVNIVNVFADVKWFFPKLRQGSILVVPLEDGDCPQCMLFVKDRNKLPDNIDIAELF